MPLRAHALVSTAFALGMGALAACALAAGCTRTIRLEEPDASADGARVDGGASRDAALPSNKCELSSEMDLLFVIDSSSSMGEEQALLAEQIPAFVRTLLEPPDDDGDDVPDFLPVLDLHVGAVTTDMGAGGYRVPTCARPDLGDDGVLRTVGSTGVSCAASYPSFLTFGAPDDDAGRFASDIACLLQQGVAGCGFEQPLEAALKALTPSTAPVVFAGDTRGHADGVNAGFLRDDSMLGVVIVTDEEDCSARDPELFDPVSTVYTSDLGLRCHAHPSALHPTSRHVEGLRALRAGRPDLFAFAVVAGIPADLAPTATPTAADYDAILADPRMQERIDEDMPTQLVPSCDVPGRGLAFPPRRLVEAARALEGQSTVASLCGDDFRASTRGIAALFGRRACARYVP